MSTVSGGSSSSSSSHLSKRPLDPVTRTALRYTISPREYELLHQYLISRAPARVQRRTPNPPRYKSMTKSKTDSGDYNTASLRAAIRVFVATFAGLKGWELVAAKLAARRGQTATRKPGHAPSRHPNARYALSFSSILLFHRLLHRFFRRMGTAVVDESASAFRQRNPRISHALTAKDTPAVGAALAGLLLGIAPSDQMRITIAIYVFTRSLEFGLNALEDGGYLWDKEEGRPWWFGSWMIMPLACGQLLHAFVLDRDCFPENYGNFILTRSPEYIQMRPNGFPKGQKWPGTYDVVDALGELSKLKWPAFVSPILFPNAKQALSPAVAKVGAITSGAHPGITRTSCALLHPSDPSCARTYLKYWFAVFPRIARFFAVIYGAFAMLAYKKLKNAPVPFLNNLAARILRISVFLTGAIGTSWASICFFGNYFPRTLLSTQRWFIGGFLGGLWAYVARKGERGNFLYSARVSIDSMYKVGKKRGWWRGMANGDVLLFVASLALLDFVYEVRPSAVSSSVIRKGLGVARGEGWVDRAAGSPKAEEREKDELLNPPELEERKGI